MGIFRPCNCGCAKDKLHKKIRASLLAALIFFVVANPQTYIVMRRLLGSRIATPNGNPTTLGLGVHAVVFMLITWGMMNIKKEGFEPAPAPAPAPTPAEDEEDEDEEVELEEEDEEEAPAPAEDDDDDEEAPAPAEDDEDDDESDDVKKAKKKIDDAWLYHAVDTGLRFGTFDVSNETAGPAARKKSAMICACPDGTKVTVSK